MDDGDCRQREGGQHGTDNRDGTGNSDAMLGSAYDGMENGERTCAPRPGRFIASLTDTALTGLVTRNRPLRGTTPSNAPSPQVACATVPCTG